MRFMPPTSPRACPPESRAVAEQTARYSSCPSPLLPTREPLSKAPQVHQEIAKLSPKDRSQTANEERLNCLCLPHRHLAAGANGVSSAAQGGLSPTGLQHGNREGEQHQGEAASCRPEAAEAGVSHSFSPSQTQVALFSSLSKVLVGLVASLHP